MDRRKHYRFVKKRPSPESRTALILSGISFVMMLVLILVSFGFGGKADVTIGAIALIGLGIAFYALFIGMKQLSAKGTEYRLPSISVLCAGIMSIAWLSVFLWGLR